MIDGCVGIDFHKEICIIGFILQKNVTFGIF